MLVKYVHTDDRIRNAFRMDEDLESFSALYRSFNKSLSFQGCPFVENMIRT